MKPVKTLKLKFALVITALILFSACSKPVYHDISFDDSLWMSYDDGDELLFLQTGTTNLDTLLFFHKLKGYTQEGDAYEEFIQIKFRFKGDTLAFQNTGLLRLSKSAEGFKVYAEFPHHPASIFIEQIFPQPVFVVNAVPYSQVSRSKANPLLLNQISRIENVWLNKEVGFVKFRDIAGNEWGLIP